MQKIICEHFRANVNAVLARKRWNRSDLARALNVTPGYISQVLNGDQEPGLAVVGRFAEALGVSAAILVKTRNLS